MRRLRLVWSDAAALERQAVHLACVGNAGDLERHLATRRRRYPLQAVPSEQGVRRRGQAILVTAVSVAADEGEFVG